jgi:hypothetical protein
VLAVRFSVAPTGKHRVSDLKSPQQLMNWMTCLENLFEFAPTTKFPGMKDETRMKVSQPGRRKAVSSVKFASVQAMTAHLTM